MSVEERLDQIERTLEGLLTLSEEGSADRILNEVVYALRVQGEVLRELAGPDAFKGAERRLKIQDLQESLEKFQGALLAPEIRDSPPLRALFEERVRSVRSRLEKLS